MAARQTANHLPPTTMQTTFKGTDSISSILSSFGKIKTNGTKTFSLEISELESVLTTVAVSAIANKEEKEKALSILSTSEQATLAKLLAKVKAEETRLAKKRVTGCTAERWMTTGTATLG